MRQTLAHPEMLRIIISGDEVVIGGSQEWYPEKWPQICGCGPTAASNLIWYLARTRPQLQTLCCTDNTSKDCFVALMREMFTYITPGQGGINTSTLFVNGAIQYGKARGVLLRDTVLEVPKIPRKRPRIEQVRDFILAALQADAPVAFLNLSNGSLHNLEAWHWVTIIALETDTMTASISDQGKVLDIDLGVWLKSSFLGGAMVWLTEE